MTRKLDKHETWREQLSRVTRALAAGRPIHLSDDLATGVTPELLQRFTDEARAERLSRLTRLVGGLARGISSLDRSLAEYVRKQPLRAGENAATDAERFLDWLEQSRNLSGAQTDHLLCLRARFAVEDQARRNRTGHLRFQELWSAAPALAEDLAHNRTLGVVLNPIRVWGRFETTALVDDATHVPADVIYFPAGEHVRTLLLEDESLERVRELTAFGPCTIDDWQMTLESFAGAFHVRRMELVALCRELARVGLVAFV